MWGNKRSISPDPAQRQAFCAGDQMDQCASDGRDHGLLDWLDMGAGEFAGGFCCRIPGVGWGQFCKYWELAFFHYAVPPSETIRMMSATFQDKRPMMRTGRNGPSS